MCDLISWVEKNGALLYLTTAEIKSSDGKKLRRELQSDDDLTGHGAIRKFYSVDGHPLCGGIDRECTNFSDPKNFPPQISEAIRAGEFSCFYSADILQMLTPQALAEYEKIEGPALAEYEKIEGPAWAEYEKIEGPAWAEYEKIKGQAWDEYKKIKGQAFWDIFKNKNTRIQHWR